MERVLSVLLLLVLLSVSTQSSTSPRLRLVVELRAPGTRYPCAPLLEQQDDSIPTNCELSTLGEIQHHVRGGKFRDVYIEQQGFMTHFYRGQQINSRAAPVDTCILSASSFLQGLYPVTEFKLTPDLIALAKPPVQIPDLDIILEKLGDAPSLSKAQSIHTYTEIQNSHNYVLNALENCPYAKRYLQFQEIDPDFIAKYREVGEQAAFSVLSKRAGTSSKYLPPLEAYSLLQDIISLCSLNPDNNGLDVTKEELLTLKQFYKFILVEGKLGNKKVTQLLSSAWLADVNNFLQDALKLDKQQAKIEAKCQIQDLNSQLFCKQSQKEEAQRLKLLLYSLEEERLFSLVRLFGAQNLFSIVEPASNLRLKLYSATHSISGNVTDYFIEFELNDTKFLSISFEEFILRLSALTYPSSVEEACHQILPIYSNVRVDSPSYSSSLGWPQVVLILVLLILTGLSLVAFMFWYEEKRTYQVSYEDGYHALFE